MPPEETSAFRPDVGILRGRKPLFQLRMDATEVTAGNARGVTLLSTRCLKVDDARPACIRRTHARRVKKRTAENNISITIFPISTSATTVSAVAPVVPSKNDEQQWTWVETHRLACYLTLIEADRFGIFSTVTVDCT